MQVLQMLSSGQRSMMRFDSTHQALEPIPLGALQQGLMNTQCQLRHRDQWAQGCMKHDQKQQQVIMTFQNMLRGRSVIWNFAYWKCHSITSHLRPGRNLLAHFRVTHGSSTSNPTKPSNLFPESASSKLKVLALRSWKWRMRMYQQRMRDLPQKHHM